MSCVTFKAAILRRPLNASPAMPKIYGSRGQTAVFRPRRINPCVNLCIKLTENASDASVFSVSLKRSFLTQVYPQIYFHSVPADKSRIPGIGKYCNTATAVSAVGFELDTNTNFEVKRISHKRRKCSGFILTATKVRFCITDTVHFDWNQCSNCRNQCSNYWNQCSFILEYAETNVRITRSSGFVLRKVFYTVPSRLIGHRLGVRLYADRVELYLGSRHQLTLPRGHHHSSSRHWCAHVVNYHHVIHSLRRKPMALMSWVYRDQLFPHEAYRHCFEVALERTTPRQACRLAVQLLSLAHDHNCEARLAQQVEQCLQQGALPDMLEMQKQFAVQHGTMPQLHVESSTLASYASLLQQQGAES